jgi:hypothetical protein
MELLQPSDAYGHGTVAGGCLDSTFCWEVFADPLGSVSIYRTIFINASELTLIVITFAAQTENIFRREIPRATIAFVVSHRTNWAGVAVRAYGVAFRTVVNVTLRHSETDGTFNQFLEFFVFVEQKQVSEGSRDFFGLGRHFCCRIKSILR